MVFRLPGYRYTNRPMDPLKGERSPDSWNSKQPLFSMVSPGRLFSKVIFSSSKIGVSIIFNTRWAPLTTISGFIPSYTHLQPWLNRVCWGYSYLITRGAPSCSRLDLQGSCNIARNTIIPRIRNGSRL